MSKRPTSQYMEEQLFVEHKLLDHGSITLVDYAGTETCIADAARVSYNSQGKSSDTALLRYLMRHQHNSPFEMATIKLRIKAPIFVARQWVRHRTASWNEQSARYTTLDNEFYVPDSEHIQPQATDNKQGRSGELTEQQKTEVQGLLIANSSLNYENYLALLKSDKLPEEYTIMIGAKNLMHDVDFPGIARELARMNLSLNFYTSWIWQVNLRNLLHFLGLRADPHAQYEIRVYADKLLEIVQGWMPNIHQAFLDYVVNAHTFSGSEMAVLRKLLGKIDTSKATMPLNMSKREKTAFWAALGQE